MKKLSTEVKAKLIYSGELLLIAIIAITLGILKLVGVIPTNPTRLLIYNIITVVGGAYFIFDFIWVLVSPKKRKKSSMLDKVMAVPVSLYLLVFDIICFIDKANGVETNEVFVKYSIFGVLLYVCLIYIFQAIYHYYHPIPMLLESIEEAKQIDLEEAKEQEGIKEENQENSETKIEE